MMTRLERRGPDSGGLLACKAAVLGHRRLAIFDLTAAGNQPMTSPDGSIAIVFNGAIYNFRELRTELVQRGARFVSQTDTEVLIQGYREWGIDELVTRCRGMFAFGLWDSEQSAPVRDRLGKPLVYSRVDGGIIFASTVRALRASGIASEMEPQGVVEYLEHGYIPDSTSIYKGVMKLPPASIGVWRPGNWRVRSYWEPPPARKVSDISFNEAVERTEELLQEAVRLRLFADVPVGALLSGGVDSALICWGAASQGAKVTAFTVATPGQDTDESTDAQATARELGIDVEVLPMSEDDAPDLDQLTSAFAEPFATQSALGLLRVSRAIREAGIKVVLTGDGGDDVFLGYPRHGHMLTVQRIAERMPLGAVPVWRAVRSLVPMVGPSRRGAPVTTHRRSDHACVPRRLPDSPQLDDRRRLRGPPHL
jgi:asparagine synthase (glutamine-hydrolysing)